MLSFVTSYPKSTCGILAISVLFFWVFSFWKSLSNPFIEESLQIKWDVGGATPSYPWIEVWVDYQDERIEPDIKFGGLPDPRLRFIDYDNDGLRDIIFEEGEYMQVVAFYPATENSPPSFKTLRNDVTWP